VRAQLDATLDRETVLEGELSFADAARGVVVSVAPTALAWGIEPIVNAKTLVRGQGPRILSHGSGDRIRVRGMLSVVAGVGTDTVNQRLCTCSLRERTRTVARARSRSRP
jgi:hypothetical protein